MEALMIVYREVSYPYRLCEVSYPYLALHTAILLQINHPCFDSGLIEEDRGKGMRGLH